MAERGRIVYQHVLVLQRLRQNIVQILCGHNEIGEDIGIKTIIIYIFC